jgi:periplasmic nitrate reductase NapE
MFRPQRLKELLAFFVLAFGIWPIVAVGVVGGYGFLVWMWQIINGPPGPPAG